MNIVKKKLNGMNIFHLRKICQKIGISCPKTKQSVIKKLLKPLEIKYKMDSKLPVDVAQVNTKMLKDLAEYREKEVNKKVTKIQKRMRGYLSRKKTTEIKKRCHKQIQDFLRTRKSIDRDKELYQKNPTKLRKKTLQIRKKQLKDCLQNKKQSFTKP